MLFLLPQYSSTFWLQQQLRMSLFKKNVARRTAFLTNWSIGTLLVAFIAGIYSVVPHSLGITVAVLLCCCFLSSLFFPLSIKKKDELIDSYALLGLARFNWLGAFRIWKEKALKLSFASWYGQDWSERNAVSVRKALSRSLQFTWEAACVFSDVALLLLGALVCFLLLFFFLVLSLVRQKKTSKYVLSLLNLWLNKFKVFNFFFYNTFTVHFR